MKNIGLDFYLLSDRISGSFDFFRNDITRLLGYASTSPLAIYETRPVNGGHYYRRGWELMLDTKNIVGGITEVITGRGPAVRLSRTKTRTVR